MNYIVVIRKLWNNVGYPKCGFDLKPVESMDTFKTIESNCEEGPLEILKKIRINNVRTYKYQFQGKNVMLKYVKG